MIIHHEGFEFSVDESTNIPDHVEIRYRKRGEPVWRWPVLVLKGDLPMNEVPDKLLAFATLEEER